MTISADVLNSMDAAGPQLDAAAVAVPVREFECVSQMPRRGR